MASSDVVAVSGVVIAVTALAVSTYQSWLSRDHNRRSVRPVLELRVRFRPGGTAGLRLTNSGLGPAVLTATTVWLDGAPVGPFDQENSNRIRGDARPRPSAHTFSGRNVLATDYNDYLLSVADYDPMVDWHAEFATLVLERMTLEIHYTFLYEEKTWTVRWPASGRAADERGSPS
jgi:hypothetical protein